MKIVRFWDGERIAYGRLENNQVYALEGNVYEQRVDAGNKWNANEVQLLAPCEPTKILCIGLNYHDHAKEMNLQVPKYPIVFMKPPSTVVGPEGEIKYPPQCTRLDYEGELGVVIGKIAQDVAIEDAEAFIFGYTCANDITARNLQPADGQWTIAKSFDTFCPIGPWIETSVSAEDLEIQLHLNDQCKQQSRTSQMIFSVPYLVSYLSKVMTLYPGDVIITGTPSGVGPMQVGDVVSVEIEKIGKLTNTIVKKA